MIYNGEINIDEVVIIGEFILNEKRYGDEVFVGIVNLCGVIEVKIMKLSD